MRFSELMGLVWVNIMENKFKVLLTSLGIIVGAATIVLVIAIGQGGKADVAAIKTAMKYLKDGELLLMFPEGTRHQDGEFGDAKTGAAMLALRTGVPIVPIYLPAEKKWFRWNPVVFGEAYYPKAPEGRKPTPEDYHAVADDLMERIEALKPQAGR